MKRTPGIIGACAILALTAFLLFSGSAARRSSVSTSGSLVVVTQGNSVTFVPRPAHDAVFIVKSASTSTNSPVGATNAVGK
jgi:hypothetical protein